MGREGVVGWEKGGWGWWCVVVCGGGGYSGVGYCVCVVGVVV